jgi:hypothetical protein
VHSVILWTVVGTCLLTAVVGLAVSVLDRRAERILFGFIALAETAVVVQSVVAVVEALRGHHIRSVGSFVGYVVGIVAVLPFTVAWARAAEPRYRGAVVAIGSIAVAVMTARLSMIWQGRA